MSTVIALVAVSVVVAVCVHRRDHALGKRMLALEEARECDRIATQRKAVLMSQLERHANGHRLVIRNTGTAEASNVTAKLDGKPMMEHEVMSRCEKEHKVIGPQSQVTYIPVPTPCATRPCCERAS